MLPQLPLSQAPEVLMAFQMSFDAKSGVGKAVGGDRSQQQWPKALVFMHHAKVLSWRNPGQPRAAPCCKSALDPVRARPVALELRKHSVQCASACPVERDGELPGKTQTRLVFIT